MQQGAGMRITKVVTAVAPFTRGTSLDDTRISTPMGVFPRHAERRSSWRGPGADLIWVLVRTDDSEVWGIGQSRGGRVTEALILEHLAGLLHGRDPLAISERVAELDRATQPYAAGGIASMGIAAVELALWDLAARAAGLPLVRLLGGSESDVPYYLTVPDHSLFDVLEPELIARARTVKIPARFGPADGRSAITRVIADLEATRERVPEHVPLSIDCFMSWDAEFARRVVHCASDLGLDWIEEPLHPLDVDGHRMLRTTLPARVASGEHVFTLREGRRLVEAGCVDVAQFDVTWCGGLEVARTLGRQAVDAGMLFAPHAAGLQPWATHLVNAFGPGAWLEVLVGVDGTAEVPTVRDGPGVGIDPAQVGLA
ncbi:L-rhamnonate dehydratase [Microbacterium marinum]|uniref:L-rhamnonate dehydratase n=1 Tax=Microbacterium marinum TaxID=421115 RepID=A0A7W7FJB1_9MICO|nr:mandelate racemase/muconate lactonizing enzyme family protein [Microbacterium marinum]MBB4668241.1 L-rhamnonate dehydratase [Microbacterium marinum]